MTRTRHTPAHALSRRLSRAVARVTAGALLCLAATAALSQAYPSRTVRIIVPFPAGGAVDAIARVTAQQLSEGLGQPFVVENRAGANGMIGSDAVVKAAPDGHTLLVQASTLVANPLFVKNVPYDTTRDLTAISYLGLVPNVLVVHPTVPANSIQELVAYLRANPKKVIFGSPPLGASGHLSEEAFRADTKLDFQIVNYKGTAPLVTDLVGGHVLAGADAMPAMMPHIRSGKLRALGVTSAKRTPALPDVPTIAEQGLPGFDIVSWYGLWGPAKLPDEISSRLAEVATRGVRSQMATERLGSLGFEPGGSTPAQFANIIREETAKLARIVKAAGIQPE